MAIQKSVRRLNRGPTTVALSIIADHGKGLSNKIGIILCTKQNALTT